MTPRPEPFSGLEMGTQSRYTGVSSTGLCVAHRPAADMEGMVKTRSPGLKQTVGL